MNAQSCSICDRPFDLFDVHFTSMAVTLFLDPPDRHADICSGCIAPSYALATETNGTPLRNINEIRTRFWGC